MITAACLRDAAPPPCAAAFCIVLWVRCRMSTTRGYRPQAPARNSLRSPRVRSSGRPSTARGGWGAWRSARRAAVCSGRVSPSVNQWLATPEPPPQTCARPTPSLAFPPPWSKQEREAVSHAATVARRAAWAGDCAKLREVFAEFPSAISARGTSDGSTPAHWACLGGHVHVLTLLRSLGCTVRDLTLCDSSGQTPFHWAATHNKGACINELTALHSDQTESIPLWISRDKRGRTPAHSAALHGNARILNQMRQHYASRSAAGERELLEILSSQDDTRRNVMDLWSIHQSDHASAAVPSGGGSSRTMSGTASDVSSPSSASASRPRSANQIVLSECRRLLADVEYSSAQRTFPVFIAAPARPTICQCQWAVRG